MVGYYQDKFPRGRVAMRGWDPQNPTKQTIALPVTPSAEDNKKPEFIWPGHVVFAKKNDTTSRYEWTKTPQENAVICVAQDASVDTHVMAAHSLVGLACSDAYKLATPFFRKNTADTYEFGTPLTWCTAEDKVTDAGTAGDAIGYIKPAAAGDTIIGYVAEDVDPLYKATNGSMNLQPNFVDAIDSMSEKANAFFVIWNTCYTAVKK